MTKQDMLEIEAIYSAAQADFLETAVAFIEDEGSADLVIQLAKEVVSARNLLRSARGRQKVVYLSDRRAG